MREIKFRTWDKTNSEWYMDGSIFDLNYSAHYGDFYFDNDHPYNMREHKLEWMQFTGLRDKNGVEIYEGDIVQDESIYRAPFWQYKIHWSDLKSGWIAYPLDEANIGFGLSKESSFTLEVIGNVFEGTNDLQPDHKRA